MAGNNETLCGGGFHHVAFKAKDFDKTLDFYIKGLGFRLDLLWGEGDGRGAMLDTGDGNFFEIFAGGSKLPVPEGVLTHVALRTENCDKAIAAAKAAGGVVTMEPTDIDIQGQSEERKIRIAFFKGLNDEVIELFQIRK